MGRQMPYYCEHNVCVDGGDFKDGEYCSECEVERLEKKLAETNSIILLQKLDAILERLPEPVPSPFLGELRRNRGEPRIDSSAWGTTVNHSFTLEQWNGKEWVRVTTL